MDKASRTSRTLKQAHDARDLAEQDPQRGSEVAHRFQAALNPARNADSDVEGEGEDCDPLDDACAIAA